MKCERFRHKQSQEGHHAFGEKTHSDVVDDYKKLFIDYSAKVTDYLMTHGVLDESQAGQALSIVFQVCNLK